MGDLTKIYSIKLLEHFWTGFIIEAMMYILVTQQFTNKWQNEYWGENHNHRVCIHLYLVKKILKIDMMKKKRKILL